MAVRYDAITPAQLTASAATYVTAGASEKVRILSLVVCNDNTVAETVTVHVIPTGATETALNKVLDAFALAAGESVDLIGIIGVQTLLATGTIRAFASTATQVSIGGSLQRITGA
jgi:hypothetical protein